ncbi:hypothetical protein TSOC_013927, partial [Tetrabaena socialis]
GCNGLPETGVAEERTWRALLGRDDAQPRHIFELRMLSEEDAGNSSGQSGSEGSVSYDGDGGVLYVAQYEDDLDPTSKGLVWLLGEQRWERRP